jgi:flagellar hook-length control protein FliK
VRGAAATATGPVAQQTFPEVTRLMSRGDGTHRVTLELRPEGLGEVRVVLTLRDGKVDVRMTTSTEARHALASDLPELHRLLAASGATETSVSVRDGQQLVSSSSWDGSRSSASSSHDLMGQTGEGTGQPRHQESPQQARTSADHIATDGVRDRARASGPNDPATGTRTTGLDVTV